MRSGAPCRSPADRVLPLGVRQEFTRDAARASRASTRRAQVHPPPTRSTTSGRSTSRTTRRSATASSTRTCSQPSARRGERAALFGSKTYQTFLTLFDQVPYRFVATATPSPNRYKELIHYAGFLGVMDTGQALTRFFQRDSDAGEQPDALSAHGARVLRCGCIRGRCSSSGRATSATPTTATTCRRSTSSTTRCRRGDAIGEGRSRWPGSSSPTPRSA
jgi:hypothetical protein